VTTRASRLALTTGLLVVTPLLAAAQDPRTGPHVRTDDATLRRLTERGPKQSRTLRELVRQIDQLPGPVYLVPSRCGALSGLSACLDHDVKVRGGYRFLRVNVMPGDPAFRQLPLLAHELQHALEGIERRLGNLSSECRKALRANRSAAEGGRQPRNRGGAARSGDRHPRIARSCETVIPKVA